MGSILLFIVLKSPCTYTYVYLYLPKYILQSALMEPVGVFYYCTA